jgi:RNA polymerase sigma factor (sigma-70 family)
MPVNPLTTQPSLLSRVRDPSDHAAWSEFAARYRELILRYAYNRGANSTDADDVLQIVLMSLSKSLRGFDYRPSRGRFRSYLGSVVRNAVAQCLARPKQTTQALDSSVEAAVAAPDEAALDALWEEEWVNHHYRLAMEEIRRTFEPRSVEIFDKLLAGETVEALARDYALSEQAVHKIKQRIRDRMKDLVAAQIKEEDDPAGSTPA